MKYYAQMIIETNNYKSELEPPQEIERDEFTQESINDWIVNWITDTYGNNVKDRKEGGAPCINDLGYDLLDDDYNLIETLHYKA